MPLCLNFIDLKKAFDSVETEAVMEALDNQGVPTQYLKLLREFYSNFTTGISPFNKNIVVDLKTEENAGRKLEWDMGVKFDGRQLHHLRFADDIVLITPSISQAERMLTKFNKTLKKTRNTRLRAHLFNTTVLPILTYVSETWAFRKQEENAVRDGIRSSLLRQRSKIREATTFAKESKIRWAGHVMRFNDVGPEPPTRKEEPLGDSGTGQIEGLLALARPVQRSTGVKVIEVIKFEQGDLGLGDSRIGRIYYLDRKKHGRKIAAYRQFLISKITLLLEDSNQPKNETKIAKDVDEVVDFETMFAKILVADDDSRNFNTRHSLRRLKDLQKLMPVVNWAQYFHSVAPNVVHEYFASNPEIIIAEIDFMKRLTNLLQSTDPRIITNYVYMRYSSSWVGELGERYEDILQEFNRVMYGRNQKAQRWISCTDNIMQGMQYVSAAMYVRRVFDKTLKNIIFQMIEDLQKVFREIVITSDWMDNETKANALDKAKQMLRQVAYPDFVLDNAKLDDHYSGFSVEESDTYSQMVGKLSKWCLEYRYKQLIKPVDRTEFNFNSAVVNAYYSSTSNSIKLPAAIIQVPFFHPTFPRALNYGGIGAVIGHEIIHGFDDIGRQFDSFGNLRDWWNAGVKKKFEERSQCIINQYGKIEVPGTGLKVNGKLTQGENIADNGGIKQAFKAYKNYLLDHGEEMRIKGLEQYNNEQMFFLGYAMVIFNCSPTFSKDFYLKVREQYYASLAYL
ncbi:hypothetical protein RB195_018025 [Necator americanus]|uniref:Peptidase family M13 n=2 Tax=Necator americanus TaxID=51031 RepID=A0ABR1C7W4_NECAM